MLNETADRLYYQIYNSLQSAVWRQNAAEAGNAVKKFLEDDSMTAALHKLIETRNFKCSSVLILCRNLMKELAKDNIPSDWLEYVFQYSLSKSFPHAVSMPLSTGLENSCIAYLHVLRIISEYQKNIEDNSWQSKYPMVFLTHEEEDSLENPGEYKRFLHAFNNDFIYEMMELSQEVTGYNTLDHICGVHYLALYIGRELKKAGLPIDLGRVSGSAAGHDIGKYGCKATELKRVPCLHYYYTDMWFRSRDITYIGHIAANHSTWDLELENLSLESLILIYSDFRVKVKSSDSNAEMHIYTLQESFEVILNKLDNLDAAKERRYQRVYSKLLDFEDFMINLGIEIDINRISGRLTGDYKAKKHHYSLLSGSQIIKNLKYLAINHNINLMYQLRDEASLNLILESARSESNWKKLREYIRIFEEYSTYLTQKQKLVTIKFLYDQLVHSEDDIRRQCAELIGLLIASFDEDYRKEVPRDVILEDPFMSSLELLDKYVQLFIYPDHKMVPLHRSYLGYSISIMLSSLFSHCRKNQVEGFKNIIVKYYDEDCCISGETKLYLLEAVRYIPIFPSSESNNIVLEFTRKILKEQNNALRLSALDVAYSVLYKQKDRLIDADQPSVISAFVTGVKQMLSNSLIRSPLPSENYVKYKLSKLLDMEPLIIDIYSDFWQKDQYKLSEISLSNLKTATEWVIKKLQINLLSDHALNNPSANGFYAAMHFCNLLKVSAVENVRNRAGEALIQIVPHLSVEQRNDVAVELLRALEINGYQYTQYIPSYLGKLILFLKPIELNEVIDDFSDKIKNSNPHLASLILKTVSIAIENYPSYPEMFIEKPEANSNRLIKMLGIILNGLAHYDPNVKQAAFSVLGKEIFGSSLLTLKEKNQVFTLIAKKLLTLLVEDMKEELLFLTNSAGLNGIYRFVSDYTFYYGGIELRLPRKVAFFPGAFDPFSLGHKEIAKAIRDIGFEVYLAVDEFSWSKKTLPNLIRKNIINMSVADELDIYIYPEDYPINIANPLDLEILKDNFQVSEIYIVVGSDVIANASAYKSERCKNSIHTFSHIIFERKSLMNSNPDDSTINEAAERIDGEIIKLALPPQLEDISSTQIRNYIDENRDISMLVDPLAQKFIYENGFYQSEPQYKSMIETKSIDIEVIEELDKELLLELSSHLRISYEAFSARFRSFLKKPSRRLLLIRDAASEKRVLGFTAFHRIYFSLLYNEFRNSTVTEYIRNNSTGNIIHIDGIFVLNNTVLEDIEQVLLAETLSYCVSKDYDYAIFNNVLNEQTSPAMLEVLKRMGFKDIHCPDCINKVFTVNIGTPCTLNLDIETVIKEPYRSSINVKEAVGRTRKRLQSTLTEVYPGHLILPYDRNIMHETLIRKICNVNGVPIEPAAPRRLGPAMCVPYGNMLSRSIVPNTVTKALHTEKLYFPDMKGYRVGSFPYYPELEVQIRILRSFGKPIMLVDDTLHQGYRIKALNPLLKKENLKVRKIIIGILSGRGKELMEIQGHEVDCAYFIPRLREWYNERDFYPFIGGDALWRGVYPKRNLLPSINMILPYTTPPFVKDATKESIFKLSQVSVENAVDILTALENEFQIINERSLTLSSMGQVFIAPRCPDHGKNMDYDLSLSASFYLKNDLELLNRLENVICYSDTNFVGE